MVRRLLKIALVAFLLGLVALGATGYWLMRQIDAGLIEAEAGRILGELTGAKAKFGAIRFATLGTASLEVVTFERPPTAEGLVSLELQNLEVDYSPWDLIHGHRRLSGVRLVRPSLVIRPPKPGGPPRPAPDLGALERLLKPPIVTHVSIKDARVTILIDPPAPRLDSPATGRSLGSRALTIEHVDLSVGMPGTLLPVTFKLTADVLGGSAGLEGQYAIVDRRGRLRLWGAWGSLAAALQPWLELPAGIELKSLGASLDGEVAFSPGQLDDYSLLAKVDPLKLAVGLPAPAGRSSPPGLSRSVEGTLGLRVRKGLIVLDRIAVAVNGLGSIEASARLDGLEDPRDLWLSHRRDAMRVQGRVGLRDLSVGGALALVHDLGIVIPPMVSVEPSGTVSLAMTFDGPLMTPRPRVRLEMAGLGARFIQGRLNEMATIDTLVLSADPGTVHLEQLRGRAAGVEARLTAKADLDPVDPRLEVVLEALDIDLAKATGAMRLPAGSASVEGIVGIAGRLGLRPRPFLGGAPIDGRKDGPRLQAKLSNQLRDALGAGPRAPTFLAALRDSLGLELAGDLVVKNGRITPPPSSPPLPGPITFEAAGRATHETVALGRLVVRCGPLSLATSGQLAGGANSPQLRATVTVPADGRLDLPTLLDHVPNPVVRQALTGRLRGAVALTASTTGTPGPELIDNLTMQVRADGLSLDVPWPPGPLESWPRSTPAVEGNALRDVALRLDSVQLDLARRALTLSPVHFTGPGARLVCAASAGPLPPVTMGSLVVRPMRLPWSLQSLKAVPVSVTVATTVTPGTPEGLDVGAMAALVPPEVWARVPQKVVPSGRVTLGVAARGPAGKPRVTVDLRVASLGLDARVVGVSEDPLVSRDVAAGLDVSLVQIRDSVRTWLPQLDHPLVEKIAPTAEIKLKARVEGRPGRFLVSLSGDALDVALRLGGGFDQWPPTEAGIEGEWMLRSLAQLTPLIPAQARKALAGLEPGFRLGGPLGAALRGPRIEGGVGLALEGLHGQFQGLTGPVGVHVNRFTLDTRASALRTPGSPWNGTVDVAGDGRAVVLARDLPWTIKPSKVLLGPGRIQCPSLDLTVLGQPVRIHADYSPDVAHSRRGLIGLDIPALDLGTLLPQLVKLDPNVGIEGQIGLKAHVGGPIDQPELLDIGALISIPTLSVRHPLLKTLPLKITGGLVEIRPDDVIIPEPDKFLITFGARIFPIPLHGSLKVLAGVPNLFKADPKVIGPRILERLGGKVRLTNMLGEEQLLRLTGDKLYKALVLIRIKDRKEDFQFKTALLPAESKDFRQRTREIVDKYSRMAKQDAAELLGFKKTVYGDENWKMVRIEKISVFVLDDGFNAIYPKEIPFWRLTVTPQEW